jgi:hypothetical protein
MNNLFVILGITSSWVSWPLIILAHLYIFHLMFKMFTLVAIIHILTPFLLF